MQIRGAATRQKMITLPELHVCYPEWVASSNCWERIYPTTEDRMLLAISLARENVLQKTGGPFGAAVFDAESGELISVGMNLVVRENNAILHAEMVAMMMACKRLASFSLGAPGLQPHELTTSCDPCAMCLGAILWSGVKRLTCGATREDVSRLGFEEGPVFPASYEYLEDRGLEIERPVLRTQAAEVLEEYRASGGEIYNG